MSKLVAIAYPNQDTAAKVMATIDRLADEYLIDLEDAVVVTRDTAGNIKLDQSVNMVKEGGISGALGGLLLGALFFAPFLGLAIGAGLGAFAGRLADYGIEDQFVKDLAAKLPPGGSAIVVVVSKGDPDKVVAQVGAFGGEIIQTSLSDEQEARLREALSVKPPRR